MGAGDAREVEDDITPRKVSLQSLGSPHHLRQDPSASREPAREPGSRADIGGPPARSGYGMGTFRDGCLMVNTGHGALRTTFSATLPRRTWARPVRPWVAITIRSMSCLAA